MFPGSARIEPCPNPFNAILETWGHTQRFSRGNDGSRIARGPN